MRHWLIALMGGVMCSLAAAEPIELARDGRTDYVIVVYGDDVTIAAERTAATELKTYLEKVTGAEFPMVGLNDAPTDAPQIVMMPPTAARLEADNDFEIRIRSEGRNLIFSGARPRGRTSSRAC